MPIRSFSSQFEDTTANCDVDNDAPRGLRQEWVDALYLALERQPRNAYRRTEPQLRLTALQSSLEGAPMNRRKVQADAGHFPAA